MCQLTIDTFKRVRHGGSRKSQLILLRLDLFLRQRPTLLKEVDRTYNRDHNQGRGDGPGMLTQANLRTDRREHPADGRRGDTLDTATPREDHAGTQKADAGYHSGQNARWIASFGRSTW